MLYKKKLDCVTQVGHARQMIPNELNLSCWDVKTQIDARSTGVSNMLRLKTEICFEGNTTCQQLYLRWEMFKRDEWQFAEWQLK